MDQAKKVVVPIKKECETSSCGTCVLHDSLEHANALNSALNNAYSVLGVGLVFFDGNNHVTHANELAKMRLMLPADFMEQGIDPIRTCFTDSDQSKLKSSLRQLITDQNMGEVFVHLTVDSEASVVMLERLDQTAFNLGQPGVAMFIFDSRRNIEVSSAGVARIFGLTRAEARLTVALVNGMTAAEYAAANSVSIHTAYSQIKVILSKTGVRRQPELVRLVLEHSPSFRKLDRQQRKEVGMAEIAGAT